MAQSLSPRTDLAEPLVFAGLGAIGTRLAAGLCTSRTYAGNNASESGKCHNLNWGGRSAQSLARSFIPVGSDGTGENPVMLALPGLDLEQLLRKEPAGWLIVTAKAGPAIGLLHELLSGKAEYQQLAGWTVVLMQNGLGVQTIARDLLAPYPERLRPCVIAASTTEAAKRTPEAAEQVLQTAPGMTRIGVLVPSPRAEPQTHRFAALLEEGGMRTEVCSDIEGVLWHKLALNCVINPLTALIGCCNGELPSTNDFATFSRPLCEEVTGAWYHALGASSNSCFTTSPPAIDTLLASVHSICAATARNRSSMLQDLSAGRRTEIGVINGFVVDYCKLNGLPCASNATLVQRITDKTG